MANSKNPVGIIGAGTMGAGIAQVAATHGWNVHLIDVNQSAVDQAIASIERRLTRQAEKGIIDQTEPDRILKRIQHASDIAAMRDCDLVIEAVVEDLSIKSEVLKQVHAVVPTDAVIASNTSSLSVTAIGDAVGEPARVVGMHFFNPAPLMPLVEVVRGKATSQGAVSRATLIAEAWGKTVVQCSDTPGFIVNRVARPFYLESFRILEDGYAGVETIDRVMRDLGGFRMGPFELTDLIGQDVNTATTRSVWEQLGKPARLKPSTIQEELVKAKHLGRKTGRGTYHHEFDPPKSAIEVQKSDVTKSSRLNNAVEQFVERATKHRGPIHDQYVFARVLVAIMNEAAWALTDKVASAEDIDTALKMGTNYPHGPLEWAESIGYARRGELLDALNATVKDNRFESPEMLKSHV